MRVIKSYSLIPTTVTITALLLITAIGGSPQPEVHFQWNYVNYTWPSRQAYERAVRDGSYVKEHNVVSGIKVWQGRLYLAVPRLTPGVPVTLTSTSLVYREGDANATGPLLEPYPSWRMQRLADCRALQFVQSMEIDPKGRLWIIDNGRIDVRTNHSKSLCPSRLMILDLEANGKILVDYTFPEGSVVHRSTVYLNDLVVDHEDGGWAYITDNDKEHPGIIVFSLRHRTSWKISHKSSMKADPEATEFAVNGTTLTIRSNIDGIGLSPASTEGSSRLLYYSALSSYETFSVPTHVLKTGGGHNGTYMIDDRYVRSVGRKPSQSDGMTVSAAGVMYFGLLVKNAICSWDTRRWPLNENKHIIAEHPVLLEWPDAFAVDADEWLWTTAKRQSVIRTDVIDPDLPNFRVLRTHIRSRGYQYYEDGRAPSLPEIERQTGLFSELFTNMAFAVRHLKRRALMLS